MKVLLLDRENGVESPTLGNIRAVGHTEAESAISVAEMREAILAKQYDALVIRIDEPGAVDADGTPFLANVLGFLEEERPQILVALLFVEVPDFETINQLIGIASPLSLTSTENELQSINTLAAINVHAMTELLREYRDKLIEIDSVEINTGLENLSLKSQHIRILKIFSRRFKGVSCRLTSVDGGMSGAEVIKILVSGENGEERIHALAKLGSAKEIHDESERFGSEVTRLLPHAYAPQVSIVESGARVAAGAFYRLLSDSHRPFFTLLKEDPSRAATAVDRLADLLGPWHAGNPHRRMQIREIRRRVVSDDKLGQILEKVELPWIYELENKEVQVQLPCLHGDLHGANVFVDAEDNPIMIDFGDVGEGPAALDPITLELSIFSHPDFYMTASWYPQPEQEWADLAEYIDGSPYAPFINACRRWAHEVSDDLAVYACAYAYLLRQLEYTDVDSELMLALLHSVVKSINNPI